MGVERRLLFLPSNSMWPCLTRTITGQARPCQSSPVAVESSPSIVNAYEDLSAAVHRMINDN